MPPEAVVADAPVTPMSEVYEKALAAGNPDEPKTETPPVTPEPAKETTKEPSAPPEPPAKPASALEAALAEQPPAVKETDPLHEFPESLPNENRKDHWARARAKMASDFEKIANLEKARQDLEQKVSTAKENPELTGKLEKALAENASLRDAITAANVELLPEFRAKYIDGRNALVARAQEKIKAYGGNAEDLKDALAMPEGRRRDEAIRDAMGEEMQDLARTKINTIIAEIDKLSDEAQAARADSQQSYERLTARQKEQLAAQQQESETRKAATFESVKKRLQSSVGTLRTVDPALTGAEDWNAGVNGAFDRAPKLFDPDASPEKTVEIAIKGEDYDRVAGLLADAWKQNAEMKKQLAEFGSVQPDARGGKAPAPKDSDKPVAEKYEDALGKIQNRED